MDQILFYKRRAVGKSLFALLLLLFHNVPFPGPLVLIHGPVMFTKAPRKMMAPIIFGDKVEEITFCRMQGCGQGLFAWIADRA